MAGVTVYLSAGCPFCEKAKLFLEEKGIAYEEVSAPLNSKAWQEMRERTGSSSLPQILVGDTPVGGIQRPGPFGGHRCVESHAGTHRGGDGFPPL